MKKLLSLVLFLFVSNVFAIEATHGMLFFGKENLYFYHLPMFHKVHNKQVVLKISVSDEIKKTLLQSEDQNYITFVPKPFDLDVFLNKPFDLEGDFYLGHFEKEGVVILENIKVHIDNIEYVSEINKNGSDEQYKIFGTFNDIYALHLINGKMAQDQLVKLIPENIEGDQLGIINLVLDRNIFNKGDSLLGKNEELNLSTMIGTNEGCYPRPTRLCGSYAKTVYVKMKVGEIYFSDDVM